SAWVIESCRRELAADIKYARQLTIKKNDTQYALRWLFI
ncbi:DUF3950 domain-containing protein, partial [Escherichia coli]|nr:DUF3950 domain-containing protein [Escherichia coli]EEQ7211730.1 DUF3950 domain-containing protein [Escherichia coli]EEU5910669.1 DUF3950 domain-containing protein [Escherichia coli]EFA0682212.1 DUF3950 domain-containing protein [Escherichia coli]EFG2274380.1 DUF3950 domain-containing protein [Escherichia coli]